MSAKGIKTERKFGMTPAGMRYAVVLVILVLWELAPRMGWTAPSMLATLSSTLMVGFGDLANFGHHLAVTIAEMLIALLIAFVGGAVGGVMLGSIRQLRDTLLPLVSSLYAVPLVILYPLFTAWVGIGAESKILFGGIYGFFPMLLATAAGMQTVDGNLVLVARSMGATRKQQIVEVMLPAAIPSVLSGLRIGAAMTAIGVVVAEMMAATAGIGFLITQNRTMFNTPEVYFGVLLVIVLAGLIDWAIRVVERKAANWYPQKATFQ